MKVAMQVVSSVVPSATSTPKPAAVQIAAMEEAMEDRKMRPTSCTWPVGVGNTAVGWEGL